MLAVGLLNRVETLNTREGCQKRTFNSLFFHSLLSPFCHQPVELIYKL